MGTRLGRQFDLRKSAFEDDKHRDNWEIVQEYMDTVDPETNPFTAFEGRTYEETISGTTALVHGLGFTPKDFLITRNTANTTVTVDSITQTEITLTVGAATTLRFLLGRFE